MVRNVLTVDAPGQWHSTSFGCQTLRGVVAQLEVCRIEVRAEEYEVVDPKLPIRYVRSCRRPPSSRRAPFWIDEEDAVRLGLLFAALKPLREYRRIDEAAGAISLMEREEVYHWFSKLTTGPEQGQSQRALRTMVSDE